VRISPRAVEVRTPVRAGPTSATPAVVKSELDKFAFPRGMDAHTLSLSALPVERRRFLAGVGRRLTPQHLEPRRGSPRCRAGAGSR
jgi:hypothetical protein